MCGIIGSIGNINSNKVVLTGLNRLEYRGYDSCGISFVSNNNDIKTIKSIERIKSLINSVDEESNIALGHTRWATHGGVNLENAHPHISHDNNMSLIHNGVIENYEELKEQYLSGYNLKSETDSEIILEVINSFYKVTNDMNMAISQFIKVTHGSYALIIYNKDYENTLFSVKNKSPLLLGKGEGFYTISSDPSAVIDKTNLFHQFDDKTFAVIKEDDVNLFNENNEQIPLNFVEIEFDYEEVSTKEYDTYMLKEIEEQPAVLRNIVSYYEEHSIDPKLIKTFTSASRIYIIASGTSYHAGLVCKRIIERKLNIPVDVELGSEFGYSDPIIDDNGVFLFLSQSGETADSMLVFNQVKDKYPIISITNVRGSQMHRNADYSLLIFAGIEVSVACTKAYTAQIAVLSILTYLSAGESNIFDKIKNLADAQQSVIDDRDVFNEIALEIKDDKQMFYLGRLTDYYLAMEAALKLKEISYINVSAFASGELKHGTISLIEKGTKVLNIITEKSISSNSRSNNDEVKARGAITYTFSTIQTAKEGDSYVVKYDGDELLSGIVAILPHQYLAYYITLALGHDVDKPRNLAKSVTVE